MAKKLTSDQAAKAAAMAAAKDHSKRPDALQRWTRDNICKANGHAPGKGKGC